MNIKRQYLDSKLEQLIKAANDSAQKGRLDRFRLLMVTEDVDLTPMDGLAYEYYQEARLCWYMGAFVATIVMSQLTFEQMLRAHYRVANGVGGTLDRGKKVDNATFADLIDQAVDDAWVDQQEAEALHRLRRDIRNPYVHTHDSQKRNESSDLIDQAVADYRKDFFYQHLKFVAPQLIGVGVEDEARETITLLVRLFPKISRGFWGM